MNPPMLERRRLRHGMFEVPIRWAGRGRPVLFLHDLWGLPVEWEPDSVLARLAEHYLVLAPSHPGYDGATGLEHLEDVLDLALYYLDLLDELLIDSPHVIGVGFGGMIAAEMASLAPQRIAKLVLAAPLGLSLDEAPMPDVLNLAAELSEGLRAGPGIAPAAAAGGDSASAAEHPAARFLHRPGEWGLRKRLHRLLAPTLLVWGEQDRIVPPAYAAAFHRRIAHSRVLSIPDASHAAYLEQPDSFSRAVLDFLDG